MEIIGNLSMILPMQGGVSQQSGNQWQKATFIIDQPSNNPNYPNPKKVCVTTMNANVIATLQQFPVGTPLKVAVSVESRKEQQYLSSKELEQQAYLNLLKACREAAISSQ